MDSWAFPSDAGTCVTWMSQKVFDIDAGHLLPREYSDTGKEKTWVDLVESGVFLPAKESYAPLKTFTQSFCHDTNQCGSAGNWQGTVQAIDMNLKTQEAKLSTVKSKGLEPRK